MQNTYFHHPHSSSLVDPAETFLWTFQQSLKLLCSPFKRLVEIPSDCAGAGGIQTGEQRKWQSLLFDSSLQCAAESLQHTDHACFFVKQHQCVKMRECVLSHMNFIVVEYKQIPSQRCHLKNMRRVRSVQY